MKLGIIIGAAIFLAVGLISLFSGNWQAAVVFIFIGLALGLVFFRGG
jgi:hypothetical protein